MLEHLSGATALSAVHSGAARLRNYLHDKGRLKVARLDRPVISIGNLTVGGTGKTPLTAEIARLLSSEGYLIVILSRGHGGVRHADPMIVSDLIGVRHGPTESGDEPYLLARRLPGVPVVVGRKRFAAGLLAQQRFPPHAFLLDDGFQHRELHRDLDIVVIDASDPWGGGRLLPAGRLREPRTGLRRAGMVVLTRLHRIETTALNTLREELAALAPDAPVLSTRTQLTGLRPLGGGARLPMIELRGVRVMAFAGIGKPQSFFDDLASAGAHLVACKAFPDHHPYRRSDAVELAGAARDAGARLVVTTAKDAVRFPTAPRFELPLYSVTHRLAVDDPTLLMKLLTMRIPLQGRRGRD